MSTSTEIETSSPTGVNLVCWKMWGGNKRTVTPVQIPGLTGVLHAQPHESERGGDLYYLSACGSGSVARLCIADVTGHGQAVATFSASLEGVFGDHIHRENPAKVLHEVNRRTVTDNLDLVSTGICLSYNSLNGRLALSNAGHPHVLLCPNNSKHWQALKIAAPNDGKLWNIPLGIDTTARYKIEKRTLRPGDRLLIYTDGLTEAADSQGNGFAQDLLNMPVPDAPPNVIAAKLQAALDRHTRTDSNTEGHTNESATPPHDDITFLILQVLPYQRTNRYTLLLRNNWPRLREWFRKKRRATV